jgi:hypothetical protein
MMPLAREIVHQVLQSVWWLTGRTVDHLNHLSAREYRQREVSDQLGVLRRHGA